MTPRAVLVGPPGAGKTTVGRRVAATLGVDFRDTDRDVETAVGKPISEIFFDDGEDEFRRLETNAVAAALREHSGVLALGGGAVLSAETRAALAEHTVIYLSVGMASASARVGLARDRPVLALNPRAMLHKLLAERDPLYLEVATTRIETDDKPIDGVASEVLAALGAK
jgi:shikimate kinase